MTRLLKTLTPQSIAPMPWRPLVLMHERALLVSWATLVASSNRSPPDSHNSHSGARLHGNVGVDHLVAELLQRGLLRVPAQHALGLGRVAQQQVHLPRTHLGVSQKLFCELTSGTWILALRPRPSPSSRSTCYGAVCLVGFPWGLQAPGTLVLAAQQQVYLPRHSLSLNFPWDQKPL